MTGTQKVQGSAALLATFGTACALLCAFILPSELIRVTANRTFRRRVFEPRLARRGAISGAVPECPSWPFAWVLYSLTIDDQSVNVRKEIGLDGAACSVFRALPDAKAAAVYIGTVRLGLRIIMATAWFDLGVVLPLNRALTASQPFYYSRASVRGDYAYTSKNVAAVSDLDRFSMGNVPPGSPRLWAHTCSCILKTFVTLYLLNNFSAWVLARQQEARREASLNDEARRTVLVTHVPPPRADQVWDVRSTFEAWHGAAAVQRVTPCVNNAALMPLAAERAALQVRLRKARLQLASDGRRPVHRMPPCSPCADELDELSWSEELLLGVSSCLAATHCAVLEQPPVQASRHGGLLRRAAFVTFATERQACIASQMASACDGAQWCVGPAPEPGSIVWANIGRYHASQIFALRIIAWAATVALCVVFIPISGFVQTWTVTANLVKVIPSLRGVLSSPATQTLVEGVLPTVLLTVLAWIWPLILRFVTVWQGASTLAEVDRGMCAKAFLFNVVVGFLSSVLAGSFISGISEFTKNPANTPHILAKRIPGQARFFMSYVIFQGVGSSGPLIARWWQALQYSLRLEEPGKEDERYPPFPQPFGRLFPHVLLQLLLYIVFSTIAPLMAAISLLYFLPALVCAKTKMFWHHEKAYEGLGRMWPLVRTLVVIILVVYQLTIVGLLALSSAYYPTWVCAVATILPTLAYARRMAGRYNASMAGAVPLEVLIEREARAAKRTAAFPPVGGEKAVAANPYLHPALADPTLDLTLAADGSLLARFDTAELGAVFERVVALALASRLGVALQHVAKLARWVFSFIVDKADLHAPPEEGPPSSVGSWGGASDSPRLDGLRRLFAARHRSSVLGSSPPPPPSVELAAVEVPLERDSESAIGEQCAEQDG